MGDWNDPRVARGMRAQFAARRQKLAAGDTSIGWKVGFGAKPILDKLGLTAAMVGSMLVSNRVDSGGTIPLAGWTNPVIEPEIALYLGRDVAAGSDRATAAAAVAAIGPIFEVVDVASPPEDPEVILAGNINHRHVVVGPRDTSRAGGKFGGLVGRFSRNGTLVAETDDPTASPGDPIAAIQNVADTVAAFGETLKAGEMIITGSIVAALAVRPEDTRFDYRLDPVGAISVQFRR